MNDQTQQLEARIAELETENQTLREKNGLLKYALTEHETLQAENAELESMLDAVGAGGVGRMMAEPQQEDAPLHCDVCGVECANPWHFSTETERHKHACDACWGSMDKLGLPLVPLYTAPQPPVQQEPVAWMYEWNGCTHITTTDQRPIEHAHPHFNKSKPLYTAPQPTENLHCKSTQKRLATLWGYVKKEPDHFRDATQMVPARQPLTDDHIYRLYCNAMRGYWVESFHHWKLKKRNEAREFARAIEQAHGITGGQ